jgi:hypothetical protein
MGVKLCHADAEGSLRAFYIRTTKRMFVVRKDEGIVGRK